MCHRDRAFATPSRTASADSENGASSRQRRGTPAADREVRVMTPVQWHDTDLADALDGLRRDEADVETPSHVEAAVLAAWDRAHAPPIDTHARHVWQRTAAIAASVIVAIGLGQLGRELQRTTQAAADPARESGTVLL